MSGQLEDVAEEKKVNDDIFDGPEDENDTDVESAVGTLDKLVKFNWSYYIKSLKTGYEDTLNDLDCIIVNLKKKELEEEQWGDKLIRTLDLNLDIDEGIAQFEKNPNAVLSLNRSKNNDRSRSLYASMANRGQDFKLDPNTSERDYFKLDGQYGEAWSLTIRENVKALPSARDIIDGLCDFYVENIVKEKLKESSRKGYQNEIISNYQKAF